MPIKMVVGGIEVTVDSPAEAAALLQSMNAVPSPSVEEKSQPEPVEPAPAPAPEIRYELPVAAGTINKERTVRRMSYEKANLARRMHQQGKSVYEISEVLDVVPLAVEKCLAGETWNEHTVQHYKKRGQQLKEIRAERASSVGKPKEPVKLPPLPPAPTSTAEDEVVELLLMGEPPAEVTKAYKITPWTLIGIWNLKFDQAKRSQLHEMASKMSKADPAIQLWGAQQKQTGFRPR